MAQCPKTGSKCLPIAICYYECEQAFISIVAQVDKEEKQSAR